MILNLLSRFWIAVIKSLRHVPVSVRSGLAALLAFVFWLVIPKRRRVTLTNLRLCFPDKTEAERRQIAKSFYRKLMRAALDHGVLWAGSRDEVAAMVRFEGVENITETVARGEHLIVISPHFVGLDAAGIGLNLHVRGCSLYQKQSNAAWDAAALAGRKRFADPVLIAKSGKGDLMAVIQIGKIVKRPQEFHFRSLLWYACGHGADGKPLGQGHACARVLLRDANDPRRLRRAHFKALGWLSDGRL